MTQQPEHVEDPWAAEGVPGDRLPSVSPQRRGRGRRGEPGGAAEQHDRGVDSGVWSGTPFERVPPQDLEAEQSVLGGMLLSKDAIADVVEVLKGHDFYRPAHETVYQAVLDLYAKGEPADPITIAAELTKRGEIGRVGGPGYLHTLVQSVPTAANAEYYAEIVHERAVLRRLVEAGTRITQMGYAADGDVDEIVNSAQSEIYAVTEERTSEDYLPLADIMEGALDEIEAIGSRSGQMTGVPTGFTDLDSLTNGLHPGQMIVIAARPAMGKCLAGMTTLVEARTSERITVADFVRRGRAGEPLEVHTLTDDWKLRSVRPSDFIPNGRRSVLKLATRLGRSISATPNHPFRTLRGWVPLEELRPGDRIAVARDLPARPSADLPGAGVLASCGERVGQPDLDLVPGEVWDLVEAEKGDLSWAEVSARTGRPRSHDWHVGQQVSRHRLLELGRALESRVLTDIAESDVQWDRVESIVPDGVAEVYDLTIDGTHNFVANDIVVHNSTLALDFARACSINNNLPSVIFSLEMGRNEIAMRLLSAESRVALHHMRSGSMTDDDWTRLARQMPSVTDSPLYIDDSPNLSMMEIRAKCRRLKQRNDLKLIVIDYLQLMQTGGSRRPESRQQEVSDMSRNLKLLAKELEVPVIALSQLNRGPEQRTDKKPMVSDLRESGCVTAGTRVLRADNGAETTMGELLESGERNIPVWSLDDSLRLVKRTMTHVFPSGTKEVFRLTLASGKEVEASANHPFLTYDGWKPLGELAEGTRIAAPRRTHAPTGTVRMPEAELIMLAHLLGDGCVASRQPVHYTSNDEANLKAVEKAAAYFGVTPRRVQQDTWWHVYLPSPYQLTHGRRNPIAAWMAGMGLYGKRSHEKFLPDRVHGLPDDQVRLFVRHLWATDGSVTVAKSGAVRVYYATTSERLARGLQQLLLRLDIRGRVRRVGNSKGRPGWSVDVSGVEDQRRFLSEVGVHGDRARHVIAAEERLREVVANTNVDTVPREVWGTVRELMRDRAVTTRAFQAELGSNYCGSALYRRAPSRSRLGRVAEVLESQELELLATSDVQWDRIVSVESLGEQDVYDATVPGTHNFVANGINVHNSIEQDADMVILLHREDAYEKESPRAGEADLIVAKHRNGPTATITVAFQGHYSRFVDMANGM